MYVVIHYCVAIYYILLRNYLSRALHFFKIDKLMELTPIVLDSELLIESSINDARVLIRKAVDII